MWLQVVLILEIAAVIGGIHCIYGRSVKLDIGTSVLFLSLLAILEIANSFEEVGWVSLGIYIPIFLYCRKVFRDRVHRAILKIVLSTILIAIIEFICFFIISFFVRNNLVLRNIIGNAMVLLVCIFVLPKFKLETLDVVFWKRHSLLKWFLLLIFLVILVLMFQGKIIGQINIDKYILVIPSILVVLLIMVKWNASQKKVDYMERTLDVTKEAEESYSELLTNVRLRQHEFKNHLTAILSAHYAYDTYEKLVEVQDEYCQQLISENKYNDLLRIDNKVIVGFLYKKIVEMEDDGIEIEYKVSSKLEKCLVPTYYLIEMLGILLDNAAEAQKNCSDKQVVISVFENTNRYVFEIRNRTPYIEFDEINSWFIEGYSSKGSNRGLGLYHIKCLCEELNCQIGCRNILRSEENWLIFSLEINKDENV
ncbi:MAG: GHKL domain-containing protein [Lachnospiraceae bacterium]|nr:GHKL domain-containing protein [Lachnospiraceae bacterium]